MGCGLSKKTDTISTTFSNTLSKYKTNILDIINTQVIGEKNTVQEKQSVQPDAVDRRVVGIFGYLKRGATDLDIRVGQIFKVKNITDKNWWFVEDEATGINGYIPSNFVTDYKESFTIENWFYLKINRIEAEQLINMTNIPGTFLIRTSDLSDKPYTLSLLDNHDQIRHYRIFYSNSGYCLKNNLIFKNLKELVEYYKKNGEDISCKLKNPPKKQAPKTAGLGKDVWEVDRSTLELLEKLGSGNFGEVWKALWNKTTHVAVKTLREGRMTSEAFLKEANTMKLLKHPKLVQLLAVCTTGKPLYIITEFMVNGNLKDYLKRNAGILKKNILNSINIQVCEGMAYLEKKNFIHRDLAARNILVDADLTCKIADFGMAMLNGDEADKSKIPIKWTAPEAIQNKEFSVKSDVWSFGILMWEVYSYGNPPYEEMDNNAALSYVLAGKRLRNPNGCSDLLYKLMIKCWKINPEDRPTFYTLFQQLDSGIIYEGSESTSGPYGNYKEQPVEYR